MTNAEAAQILNELLKHPIGVIYEGRTITPQERLALEKAKKALQKLESMRRNKKC